MEFYFDPRVSEPDSIHKCMKVKVQRMCNIPNNLVCIINNYFKSFI